ncbi:MAG: hypothetical protein JNL01_09670 [Bdellovibrionales bacterium]|nr:hypothetical protein [Bdellovibrionales bacterium]
MHHIVMPLQNHGVKRFSFAHCVVIFALLAAVILPRPSLAWGPLGHRMVAETAMQLLEKIDPKSTQGHGGWGSFLSRHRFELGYYSIIPDSHFRAEDGMKGKLESPTHFFDLDVVLPLGTLSEKKVLEAIAQIPADYADYQTWMKPKLPAHITHLDDLGTAPWRIEQLMALIHHTLKDVKSGKGTYQEGRRSEGDAKKIYEALRYIGILTHYTADMSMPHHSSEDWNSYAKGHGGIHFYFENDCVDELEPGVSEAALKMAVTKSEAWLKQWRIEKSPPSKVVMNALWESFQAIDRVLATDKKHAVTEIAEKSATKKSGKNAKRKPARFACQSFKPLLVEQIAKGAALTSLMVSWVLPKDVDFASPAPLKFFDFEIHPEYIEPSYQKSDEKLTALRTLAAPKAQAWKKSH